jgi:hypothetical protein
MRTRGRVRMRGSRPGGGGRGGTSVATQELGCVSWDATPPGVGELKIPPTAGWKYDIVLLLLLLLLLLL